MTTQIIGGDCVEVMATMAEASVDLVVTSPPYWNQRAYAFWPTYAAYMGDVARWIKTIARVLKPGRHCFWVIPDKLPWPPKDNGTGERLYLPVYADTESLAAAAGFICEFPIIWDKRGPDLTVQPWSKKMWGSYPYPIGIIHTPFTERICVWRRAGVHGLTQAERQDSQITAEQFNTWARDIWSIEQDRGNKHPASYPVEIPERLLILWSCRGDTVLDPFCGSGTTGVACQKLARNFVGIEIKPEYAALAEQRLNAYQPNLITQDVV